MTFVADLATEGGVEAAAEVGPPQLLVAAAVGPLAVVAVVRSWRCLTA